MKHLKIGLVALGFAMLLASGVVLYSGNRADAQYKANEVAVKVSNGEIAVNVPTDTALTAFDRFLDRFLPSKESIVEAPIFSAIASPDIASPYVSVSGVRKWYARSETFIQSSTTLCSIESPRATSTLTHASIWVNVGSSTTETLLSLMRVATPTFVSTSTGTQIDYDIVIPLGGNVLYIASTTVSNADATNQYGAGVFFNQATFIDATTTEYANQWLVFALTGGEGTGQYTPTGRCQAEFLEI